MSDILIKMAQAATKDETLFAHFIQRYASQKSLSWEEVADDLHIGKEQLAKLALCSYPEPALFDYGILQIADYVGVERSLVRAFVAEVDGRGAKLRNQASGQLKNSTPVRESKNHWNIINLIMKQRKWAVGVVFLLMFLFGAFVFAQPTVATAATLVVNEGQATIVQENARSNSQRVIVPTDGASTVSAGDHIYLTAASTAQLRLIDGSTIDLAAGTEINVDELVIDDATYRVHLNVFAGRTLSRVVTVLGIGDRFEISTPSSTASVRGTVFTVEYISANETYISCDEGKVEVTLEGQESQIVAAGMEVTAVVGQPLQVKSQGAPDIPTPAPTAFPSPTVEQEQQEEPSNEPVIFPIVEDLGVIGPFESGPPEHLSEVPGVIEPPDNDYNDGSSDSVPDNPPDNGTPPESGGTPDNGDTVTICHSPGTPAENTLTLPESALQGHLGHGDTLGACPPDDPPDNVTPPDVDNSPGNSDNSNGSVGNGNDGGGNGNNGNGSGGNSDNGGGNGNANNKNDGSIGNGGQN